MTDPHAKDAEAMGRFFVSLYTNKRYTHLLTPDFAYWLATWAGHWARRSHDSQRAT